MYEGTYMNDNISGEGQYLFSNGTIYEGSFENNLMYACLDSAMVRGR